MSDLQKVSTHYTHGGLIDAIQAAVTALGKTPDSVTVDDLAPVDEFHIGGRQASADFLDQLGLAADSAILDAGCGLGGTARFIASRYGARVTAIDLTAEYVETGRELCRWVGLDERITLLQGSVLDMPFADAAFDAAYTLHVGMNIDDKRRFYTNVYRVLRPGAVFGVYDIMGTADGLTWPVPWATTADTSFVATPEHYRQALQATGFDIVAQRDRRDFALTFFEQMRARMAAAGGPPPLGLHIVMGSSAAVKIQNMVQGIAAGRIAPLEFIARKPA
jgi:SAM-dependent methyltransferase